jgi:nicotinate-nucleotide pyrophosphorylase (carboxylating)
MNAPVPPQEPPPGARTPDLRPADHVAFLQQALAEDEVERDVTTAALLVDDREAVADLVVKAPGVVCGLPLVPEVFRLLDPGARFDVEAEDGDRVGAGTRVLVVTARASALLRGERTALNVVQRLSGIATLTAAYVERAIGTGAQIVDTRKTTPGWRVLEKYAVRRGGGVNHRMSLADAAMIKENHLRAAYGRTGPDAVGRAVAACRARLGPGVVLYVEVEDQAELEAAVAAGAADPRNLVLMLDDFDLGAIRRAIAFLRSLPAPRPTVEVTGGVTLERVEALAATGVHRLSVGALTHSAPALDMSLKIRAGRKGSGALSRPG